MVLSNSSQSHLITSGFVPDKRVDFIRPMLALLASRDAFIPSPVLASALRVTTTPHVVLFGSTFVPQIPVPLFQ